MLSVQQIQHALRALGFDERAQVESIKTFNHVYRITTDSDVFYLKTYTKDWYGDDPASTDFCVLHETAAWEIMRRHAVAGPDVFGFSTTCDNPIGRPFVVTRRLVGSPLTDLLHDASMSDRTNLLMTVGTYLRQLHSITFKFAGYLSTPDGPDAPPDPNEWQHRCWSADSRQGNALEQPERDRAALSSATYEAARTQCLSIATRLASAYVPPRFTHGDCHAHQFFIATDDSGQPRVSGVIDMEVSSAGDCDEDLLKLSIELGQLLPHEARWWESLFAGYGHAPDFDAFRLRLLGVAPNEFWLAGHWMQTSDREKQLRRFLEAPSWEELFAPVN